MGKKSTTTSGKKTKRQVKSARLELVRADRPTGKSVPQAGSDTKPRSAPQVGSSPRARSGKREKKVSAGDACATTSVGSAHPTNWLTVVGARQNNLRDIDVAIPLGRFVCVTGVSGSGKSSLVNDIIREALARDLNGAVKVRPGDHDKI